MSKEELLAEARRRYPEGTIHSGYSSGNSRYTVKGPLYMDNTGIYSEGQSGCIYHNDTKKWAEIISTPKITSTNEDNLARAIRDYPVGCTVKSAYNGKEYRTDMIPKLNTDGTIIAGVYLLHDGKWAEIVSKPSSAPTKKDLVLAKVKEMFPIGTVYKNTADGGPFTINSSHTFHYSWRGGDDVYLEGNPRPDGFVYKDGEYGRIISSSTPKLSSREDNLAYAKLHYPEGTIHGGFRDSGNFTVKGELYFIGNSIYCRGNCGCIYEETSKHWAKILSTPKIVSIPSDLHIGTVIKAGHYHNSASLESKKPSDDLEFQNPIVIASKRTKRTNPLKIIT